MSDLPLSRVPGPAGTHRIEPVQVLRGVAAMLVVYCHAGLFLALAPQYDLGRSYLVPSDAFAKLGAIGVDLFFVISGFVMTLSARRFVGPAGATVFLVQRFIRLAPLFYLACLAMLAEALRARLPLDPVSILNSITFIPIFDDSTYSWPLHYLGWTLAFEWVFYLLVAMLIAGGRGGQRLPLLALLAVIPLVGIAVQPQLMVGRVLSNPIIWEFALGSIGCILYERYALARWRWLLAVLVALLVVAAAIALRLWPEALVAVSASDDTVMGESNAANRALLWGVPAFVFFLAVVSFGDVGDGWLGRLLKLLGDASYSIYLSHLFVLMALRELLNRVRLDPDLIVIVMMILAAWVGIRVYRWVENPLLIRGQRLIRNWSTRHMRSGADYQPARARPEG